MADLFSSTEIASRIVHDAQKTINGVPGAAQHLIDEVNALTPNQWRLLAPQLSNLNYHSGDYPYVNTVQNACHQITGLYFTKGMTTDALLSIDLTRTNGKPNPETCTLEKY